MSDLEEIKTKVSTLSGEMTQVKTDVEVVKHDVADLKQNESDAKVERGRIHDKLEEILKVINQRIGAERVRARLRKWAWDAAKIGTGAAATGLAWLAKILSGS